MEPDLNVTVHGIRFKNPLVVAPATPTGGARYLRRCFESGAGAVVAKSVSDIPAHQDYIRPRFTILNRNAYPWSFSNYSSEFAAWQSVDEWRPIFEGGVATAEQTSFLAFLIVVSLAGVALLWTWQREPSSSTRGGRRAAKQEAPTSRRKLDLITLLIAGLTIVMAIKSRRFIPIACICSAPLLGQGLDSLGTLINRLSPMAGKPGQRERVLRLSAFVLLLLLSVIWGWRFLQVYVRPWPHADGPSSLFSRATWLHRRGFDVCQFIWENRLEGRMYNSWIEGGSLEWCQQPDPDSGRTPLQVFIDGRAQGAFPLNALVRYLALEGGGPIGLTVISEGREMRREEARQIGAWLDVRLKEEGVSVVLLPEEDSQKPIMRGLLNRDNWQVAFLAPYHVLFVNVDTPRGRELVTGASDGTTRFPDESSRLLTRSYNLFRRGDLDGAREGLSCAIRAFSVEPAALAVQTARRAAAFPQLVPRLDEFARDIVSDYQRNLKRYLSEPGFLKRTGAAVVAATYLRDSAQTDSRPAEAATYGSMLEDMEKERARVWGRAFW